MFETVAVVLIILWLLGMFTAHAFGGLIHVLLIVALVAVVVRVVQGRRVV